MGKPWAKTEIDFINHPKFRALNSNAICLWIEGKNYCDKHMTDGLIPTHIVKQFRFNGRKSVESLMASCGPKNESHTHAPLWELHPVGFKMHDYLDYNDCRDVALARIQQAEDEREKDRDRKATARAAKKAKRDASGKSPENVRSDVRDVSGVCPEKVRLYTVPVPSTEVSKEQKPPVARFLELYETLFEKAHGVRPLIVRKRDPGIAKQLITKLGEPDALALLQAFFESEDRFIQDAGHGLNIFAGQANKLLSARKLREPDAPIEDWREQWGYCFHTPTCTDSEACRVKRASEKREAVG